jgi:hypothetical protein
MKKTILTLTALAGLTTASLADCDCLPPQHKADLEAMIEQPASDLSQLNEQDRTIAGQLYAQYFLKTHPGFQNDSMKIEYLSQALSIRHNLYGMQGSDFALSFRITLKSLIENP